MNRLTVLVRIVGLCVLFSSGFGGCATTSVSLRKTERTFTPEDYRRTYDQWTRNADTFSLGTLSDVLNATATFLSWEFRWAYAIRYAHDHGYSTPERDQLVESSLAEAQGEHRFFITLSGTNFRESDLTSDRSAWRVLLVDPEGRSLPPTKIEKVASPSASEKAYFPSISSFRQTFRVTFAVQHADGSPVLRPEIEYFLIRFAGAAGVVDLRWNVVR